MQTKKSPISDSGLNQKLSQDGRFRRQEHLKKRIELTRVFKKGQSVRCSGMKLFFLANGLPYNRIAFTFVRKYGNAVERNRARRLGREAYRLMKGGLKTGYDLVLLICHRSAGVGLPSEKSSLTESAKWLKTLFIRANMLTSGKQASPEREIGR